MARLTVHRWLTAGAFTLLAICSRQSAAQTTSVTIDSVLRALRAGDSAIDMAMLDPARHRALDSISTLLRELRATDLSIADFGTAASAEPPRFLEVFRWDRSKSSRVAQPALASALRRLQQIVMPPPNGLGPRILAQLQQPGYVRYVGAMDQLQTRVTQLAQAASTAKLRRYELKFGSGAPLLNPVETTLNYFLARVPGIGFGPTAAGPGPLEMIAAYTNSDITPNAGVTAPRVVSSAHVGLRVYTFDTTSTKGTLGRILYPQTISLGGAAFSPTDRPLSSPLQSGRRWGPFLEWGQFRVSAVLGKNWRALLGSSAQLIPHLF